MWATTFDVPPKGPMLAGPPTADLNAGTLDHASAKSISNGSSPCKVRQAYVAAKRLVRTLPYNLRRRVRRCRIASTSIDAETECARHDIDG
jgi:hypothetical protein